MSRNTVKKTMPRKYSADSARPYPIGQSVLVNERFEEFDRPTWAALRESTPMTLSANELSSIRGVNEQLDTDEVEDVYLPLSRLLNLHIIALQQLAAVTDTFLATEPAPVPYIIGIGGSVAVGKSTTARVLQILLSRWPDHPNVGLVTTDGFLYSNAELERRGLMRRKGFPESYDTAALIDVMRSVKSGDPDVVAPVYSHLSYDIVPNEQIVIGQPDVLIVEGLNVLQGNQGSSSHVVSDFFDFSIYVDAEEHTIRQWYIDRFLALRDSVFANPDSYFRHYSDLQTEEAIAVATDLWDGINAPNLEENIAPTRHRANCILGKVHNHRVERVLLQK